MHRNRSSKIAFCLPGLAEVHRKLTNWAGAVHIHKFFVILQDHVEETGDTEKLNLLPLPGAHGACAKSLAFGDIRK